MSTRYVQQFVFYPPPDIDVELVEDAILDALECDGVDGHTESYRESTSSSQRLPVLVMSLFLDHYHHPTGSPDEYVPDSSKDIISVVDAIDDHDVGVKTIHRSTAPVFEQ